MQIKYTKHLMKDGRFWLSWAGKTDICPRFFEVMTNIKAVDHMQQLRRSLEAQFPGKILYFELFNTVLVQ